MDKSAVYRIVVEGVLDERWVTRLGDMQATIDRSGQGRPITRLEGPVPDQAALAGVLETLYELRLPVLTVERVEPDTLARRERDPQSGP